MKRRLFLGCATSLAVAGALYVAALPSCGGETPAAPVCPKGEGGWFRPPSDPKCCAPLHNQYVCPGDADPNGTTCAVVPGLWKDDAGVGQSFPVGCIVELTYCNTFYEGTPQTCECVVWHDAGSWGCGI